MDNNGAIREYSSSGVSTFLHHTEVGEAIKNVMTRPIYWQKQERECSKWEL
jgi:hypothetical protein